MSTEFTRVKLPVNPVTTKKVFNQKSIENSDDSFKYGNIITQKNYKKLFRHQFLEMLKYASI